jgi:uncharacterized protein
MGQLMKASHNFFMRLIAVLISSILLTTTASCGARNKMMQKSYPADKFFTGSALQLAQAIDAENLATIDQLSKTVDLNRPGIEDMTLLYYAMQGRKLQSLAALIKLGANPEQEVPGIGKPIDMAVRMQEPPVLKAMLDAGANPNAKNKAGTPILFEAAFDENINSLALLLAANANVNAQDSLGQTAIFQANRLSSFHAVKMMIDRGAKTDVVDKRGLTFAWSVHKEVGRQAQNPEQLARITAIKNLMMQRGIKFPPDPPQVVRQKMGIPE